MCPPRDQAPAVLDQADPASMPLPESGSHSPDTGTKKDDSVKAIAAVEMDENQEVLAPLPSEIDTTVATSATGSLPTIPEHTDFISSNDELSTAKDGSNESTPTKSLEHETTDQHASTEPTDVLPPAEPESDKVTDIAPARLDSQHKDCEENAFRKATSETVVAGKSTFIVSEDGGEELKNATSEALESVPIDIKVDDPAKAEDHKFVDPNDKENIGNDVIKFFYTSSTRKRPSSPVATAPGCCNPHLHRDSDLYIKAKGEGGKAYVFEVVSSTLEKASPKFEAMIYGSHTRGNKEEWVWELNDNP